MTRIIMGPFNRVEGDLEIRLERDANRVREAWVSVPMYRGFEQILQGKTPDDALVITPRICGICSVSQSVAAAYALADMANCTIPANAQHCINLMLACENLADHLTHFYLFFMPDFARQSYANESWYAAAAQRFTAIKGTATRDALPARAAFMHILGLLGGHWPHTLSLQIGGVSKALDQRDKIRLLASVQQFRRFLETRLFGDTLETIAALDSVMALEHWRDQTSAPLSDFRHFLQLAQTLQLAQMGRAADEFLSYVAYRMAQNTEHHHFAQGVWQAQTRCVQSVPFTLMREDLHASWMAGDDESLHPFEGITLPDHTKSEAYSWNKAPRLAGKVVETGALARQMMAGHPLIRDLVAQSGGNVQNRVIARLLELALVVPFMENWIKAIQIAVRCSKVIDAIFRTSLFKKVLAPRFGSADYRAAGDLRTTLVKTVNEDLSSELSSISQPTLLLWGEEDQQTPLDLARNFKRLIPHSQLFTFPHKGHEPFEDVGSHLMAKYIIRFLKAEVHNG